MHPFLLLDAETQACLLFARLLRAPRPIRTKIQVLTEQQGHRCCYCGVPFIDPPAELVKRRQQKRWFDNLQHRTGDQRRYRIATIDHIVPKVIGGEAVWENEAAACYDCNTKRGHMDAIEFFENRLNIIAGMKEGKRAKRRLRKERKRLEKLVTAVGIEPTTSIMS